ncbi:MAG: flagellar biosynthetic protein FliO [Limnochordia bacterium]|jgi:flagellar biogenesis protein FliO|nr:flagellar biosynthetic protein FliO [Limnochordia bacterium]MDI9464926.1 flagellar biosynthetic protein FliO [Bacillota bacterium]NLO95185.1 flagellar biosynthetic protein FliO [Bacillota bacterium]HAN95137.1 hypothetical protein [Bacillota bacterium]HOB39942.1 flagellar biosynthetic protein FliO [Limnochordia bacterium]
MDAELIWGLVRVVLALAIVVPLTIFATRWYGRRQGQGQNLRIKEVLSLGTNRALYVVIWEDRELLLGVTAQSITVLDQKPLPHLAEEEALE